MRNNVRNNEIFQTSLIFLDYDEYETMKNTNQTGLKNLNQI